MTTLLIRTDEEPAAQPVSRTSRLPQLPLGILTVALVCWVVAVPTLAGAKTSDFGLLATGSPALLASILLVVLGFAAAVRRGQVGVAVIATLLMVLVQRAAVSVATAVPLYSWTYKHLGVVDYIAKNGHVAHGADIYHGWPGLFAATAWFSGISGIAPITIAHWFTPVMHVLLVGLVIAMARAWGASSMVAVTAAFLVESFNWVAQDYYSPQAVALLLAVGLLTVVGLSRDRPIAPWLIVLLFAGITVTHQLTPYWLLLATGLLAVTRRLRPWWLPGVLAVIAGGYLLLNWNVASHFPLLSFNPVANARSNIATTGSAGQQITSLLVRALSVLFWLSAAIAAVVEKRRGQPVLARIVLAFSSFMLLGGQGYGGEAIFRVFLYALPGCALLVAPRVVRLCQARMPARWLVSALLVVATAASAQGFFGGWFANRMTQEQVTFSEQLLARATFPSYLTVAAPVWPERPTSRYVDFVRFKAGYDYPMVYAAKLVGSHFDTDADYQTFMNTVAGRDGGPTYLIISRQMEIYDTYFGILPPGALQNLRAR
ncbi:MAG: hypothetical protein QOG52_453, partial [Frankiaceae bacterium]|nr:hypothetical protein [Frankiaceae bacterium]